MHILVTGLDGFTGRYMQAELEAYGHTVVGLSCDLTDPEAVAAEIAKVRPEAVVHLAGISFVGHGNANAFYEVNLIGTRNLLDALALYPLGVRSILLASSANVYGNGSEDILSEDDLLGPTNDYAVSKLAMEQMAHLWAGRLPLFIVRPFNYTGVGQHDKFLIPKIVSHFRDRKKIIELGNLDVWREFGDVRAVVCAYRRLLELCPEGKTFNISTSQTYSLREVVALFEKITCHPIKIQVNPEFIRTNEVRILTGNNDRLNRAIGEWQAYSLEDTLRWMLNGKSALAKGEGRS